LLDHTAIPQLDFIRHLAEKASARSDSSGPHRHIPVFREGPHGANAAYRNMARCTIRRISGNPSERSSGAMPDDERSVPLDAARSSFVGRKAAHTTTDKKTSP
jgi:hypothetical protein